MTALVMFVGGGGWAVVVAACGTETCNIISRLLSVLSSSYLGGLEVLRTEKKGKSGFLCTMPGQF